MKLIEPIHDTQTVMAIKLDLLMSKDRKDFYTKLIAGLQGKTQKIVAHTKPFALKPPIIVDPQFDVELM